MTGRWVNREEIGSDDVFRALHSGLTVKLISTRRADLASCKADEILSDVMERNTEPYDFLPVTAPGPVGETRIIGLFHAARYFGAASPEGCIGDYFDPLAEDFVIGADASILDFLNDADEKPCRLVVSGSKIVGLVSLSDLQKLPVRAALFALITGFELTMLEAIKQKFGSDEGWMSCLNGNRRGKIEDEIAKSQQEDGYVDSLLFTQFCDKADIVRKSFDLSPSKTAICTQMAEFQDLRDNLAHANEYAATPEHARKACTTVRNLLALREEIANA